ncbi:MAG: lipid A-modifier LpxR family protein, partial [Alphaproteobacteria bacterium]
NIFLDGNSFRESRSVDKHSFVGSVQAGLTLRYGRYGLTYAQTLQTPEFRGQKSLTNYGSLRLSAQF